MVRKLNWLVASTSTTFQRAITWTQTWAQITSQVRGSMKVETKVREAILARPIRPLTHTNKTQTSRTGTNRTPTRLVVGPIGPQRFKNEAQT